MCSPTETGLPSLTHRHTIICVLILKLSTFLNTHIRSYVFPKHRDIKTCFFSQWNWSTFLFASKASNLTRTRHAHCYSGALYERMNIYKWRLTISSQNNVCSQRQVPPKAPQWGAADAEIKFPSGENTELKRSPFKAWSRSVYSHTCYVKCQGFLPCLFLPSGPFTCIFSKTADDISCVGCG